MIFYKLGAQKVSQIFLATAIQLLNRYEKVSYVRTQKLKRNYWVEQFGIADLRQNVIIIQKL